MHFRVLSCAQRLRVLSYFTKNHQVCRKNMLWPRCPLQAGSLVAAQVNRLHAVLSHQQGCRVSSEPRDHGRGARWKNPFVKITAASHPTVPGRPSLHVTRKALRPPNGTGPAVGPGTLSRHPPLCLGPARAARRPAGAQNSDRRLSRGGVCRREGPAGRREGDEIPRAFHPRGRPGLKAT